MKKLIATLAILGFCASFTSASACCKKDKDGDKDKDSSAAVLVIEDTIL